MKPADHHGPLEVAIVILSPLIVTVMTAVFLAGWWAEAVWRRVRND